jgi:RNA polymerase sigma-70 factor (ECF subfamily)
MESLSPSDIDLIERSRRGDHGAFNAIVETYQRQVFSVCLRMLGSVEAAEDVTQETFLSVYRHLDGFKGELFRPWLFRIATNACTDELRRRKRRPVVSIDPEEGNREPLPIPDRGEGPEAYALRAELRETIEAALLMLPEDQRLAVILCDVEGFSYEEIAVTMKVAVGTVKSRINRARSRLRQLLAAPRELLTG